MKCREQCAWLDAVASELKSCRGIFGKRDNVGCLRCSSARVAHNDGNGTAILGGRERRKLRRPNPFGVLLDVNRKVAPGLRLAEKDVKVRVVAVLVFEVCLDNVVCTVAANYPDGGVLEDGITAKWVWRITRQLQNVRVKRGWLSLYGSGEVTLLGLAMKCPRFRISCRGNGEGEQENEKRRSHGIHIEAPNDPRLNNCRVRRAGCMVAERRWPAAM